MCLESLQTTSTKLQLSRACDILGLCEASPSAAFSVRLAVIVCSCNVISDHDIRSAIAGAEVPPQRLADVYACAGVQPRCGRCAPSVQRVAMHAQQGDAHIAHTS